MGRRRLHTWNPQVIQSLLDALQVFDKAFVDFFQSLNLIGLPGYNSIKGTQGILKIGQADFQLCNSLALCHEASILE